jgi:copper(I)-binding protein
MTRSIALAALAAAALLVGCGKPSAPVVAVTDAWCRASPNGAQAGGCFATFTATADDRLLGGATPRAAALQVHEMSMADGMMKMGAMANGLPLPAGEAVTLAPGGTHLMLTGLTQPLVEGETVALTLRFASAPEVTIEAQVRGIAAGGMATMHH